MEKQETISITAEIKKKLHEIPEGQQKTYLELLVNRIIKQAVVDGNEEMIMMIWSYLDTPPGPEENQPLAASVVKIDVSP
jgi:hypothetical protein